MREPGPARRHRAPPSSSTTRSSASATTSTTAARRSSPASSRCRAAGTSSCSTRSALRRTPFCKSNQVDRQRQRRPGGPARQLRGGVQRLPAVLARAPTCRSGRPSTRRGGGAAVPGGGRAVRQRGVHASTARTPPQNQDNIYSFLTTSSILPAATYPQFASRQAIKIDRPPSFDPPTGTHYAFSQAADDSYKRLSRTVDLTGKTAADLSFTASYDTEPGWDYLAVEAHTVGQDDWTTLPDANGHTTSDIRATAAARRSRSSSEHPFMAPLRHAAPREQSRGRRRDVRQHGHDRHVQRRHRQLRRLRAVAAST